MATPKPEHRHIGAGVYASFDGYKTTNQIALDNEVIQEKKTSDTTAVTLESNLMLYDCTGNTQAVVKSKTAQCKDRISTIFGGVG